MQNSKMLMDTVEKKMGVFDIIIIGNGILGLSTAYALIQQNKQLSIAIVGPMSRPGCASTAAGAMLGCFGEVTKYTYQSSYALKKLEYAIKAKQLWPDWVESINSWSTQSDRINIQNGTFIFLNSQSGFLDNENYQAIKKALVSYNESFEEVDPEKIPFIKPIMNYRPLQARYLPNEGYINTHTLLEHLQRILNTFINVQMIDQEVLSINTQSDKICSVTTQEKVLSSSTIILAAGAFSQKLLDTIPALNFEIPRIFAGVGCSAVLELPNHGLRHVIRSPNRAGACGIHTMGYDANHIYVGATNYAHYSPKIRNNVRSVYYLLQNAMEQINQNLHDADLIQWSTGCRPLSVDTFPLIGETSIKGLWLLSGTYRDGFHFSPLLAQEIARKILGSTESWIGDTFPALRPPIQIKSRLQSIEDFVNQFIASGYEHGMNLPRTGWDEYLPQLVRARIEKLYSLLDCDYGLPTELIIMLERDSQLISALRPYLQSISSVQTISDFAITQ